PSIKFQKKPSLRFEESRAHIVDEEFPIRLSPFQPFAIFAPRDPVEANTMRGDEIEFFAEIEQRFLGIDSRDDAANTEEFGRSPKERFVIGVEPETVVSKHPAEIEKITWAAAQIQDVEGPRPIKPEVLQAFYVNAYPVVSVLICVDLSCVRSIRIRFPQF